MKNKTTVAMLLLAIFALSSIAVVQIKPAYAAGTVALSDTELYNEFAWKYESPSSLTGKTDVAGPGVQFDLANLAPKAGIEDIFPVSSLAGGADYFAHPSDFTGYDAYSMLFVNVGSSTFQISLYMNTGFINSGAWGTRDWTYDTFWKSNTITLAPHESGVLTLDFSNVYEAWNIADDPVYHGYSNGVQPPNTLIFRLNEVTSFGFEVLGSGSASVIASGTLTHLYIDPPETSTPDSFFDVYVALSDFTNLAGFDIQLTWDSTHISMSAVDYATYCTALWGAEGSKWNKVFEDPNAGDYELAVTALAASASNAGASYLFKVTFHVEKTCNFPLSTAITFTVTKLSDNATPVPNPIPATITNGLFTTTFTTRPDITFNVLKKNRLTGVYEPVTLPDHFEYCNLFEVEVYVSHIHDCSPLHDYDITIHFDPGLAVFVDVDAWGVLGTGVYSSTTGVVHVWDVDGSWFGEEGLLFTLTFHVEFALTPTHIWKYLNANFMSFNIWLFDATLSFGALGTIPMSGIDTPLLPLTFDVHFIRGDVDCDGAVTAADIGTVASYYAETVPPGPLQYDLTTDGIIDIYDIVTIATNFGYPIGLP